MKKLEELGISPAPWDGVTFCHPAMNGYVVCNANLPKGNNKRIIVASDVRENNARLIAAAPEIYDAAERLLRFHDESCIHGSRTFAEITRDYQKAWSDLRSALRKASGESEVEA